MDCSIRTTRGIIFGIEKNRDSKKGSGTLYYKLDIQTITDKVINI